MENLEHIIANNLIYLRKNAKLTQLEFGEKFNYSDKTVSKWELGTVVPSVEVLKDIADFYNVSVDYILTEHRTQKDYDSEISKVSNPADKIIIICLGVLIAWVIAAVVYASGFIRGDTRYWMAFLWAVPASFAIISYLIRRYFKKSSWPIISVSCFVWSLLAATHVHMLVFNNSDYWYLYIVGIPVQAMLLLLLLRRKTIYK